MSVIKAIETKSFLLRDEICLNIGSFLIVLTFWIPSLWCWTFEVIKAPSFDYPHPLIINLPTLSIEIKKCK